MNTDVKILNKSLAHGIHQQITETDQVRLIPGMQGWLGL
jgi:hypothetical protein